MHQLKFQILSNQVAVAFYFMGDHPRVIKMEFRRYKNTSKLNCQVNQRFVRWNYLINSKGILSLPVYYLWTSDEDITFTSAKWISKLLIVHVFRESISYIYIISYWSSYAVSCSSWTLDESIVGSHTLVGDNFEMHNHLSEHSVRIWPFSSKQLPIAPTLASFPRIFTNLCQISDIIRRHVM